jgi:Predicted membrane protein (DUF2142)
MSAIVAGDRRVWIVGAALLALIALTVLVYLLRDADRYTGTNSVGVRGVVTEVKPGQRLCVADFDVPDGTGRVELSVGWAGERRPALALVLRAGETVRRGNLPAAAAPGPGGPLAVNVPVREVDTPGESAPGRLCLKTAGGTVAVGGTAGLQADQEPPRLDGEPLQVRVALRFRGPEGSTTTLLSALPDAIRRAALFRPGIAGPWLYAGIFLVLSPALALVSLRLLATRAAGLGRTRTAAATIGLIAFLNAAAWALITPAWHGPDEPDHFAYAQSIAERGHTPDKQQGEALAFSSRSVVALDAVRTYSVVGLGDTKPPWLEADEAHYRAQLARSPGREDDGGGFLFSTSSHLPGYYLLTVPAYALADSQNTFSELTAMRLVSALLGALTALCAFLTVRELAPRREWLAVGAGVMVAFHPMLAFMFGVVNNDAGVNAAAALLVFLLVRGLRRGVTVPLAVALGATLALLPAMKATGAALYPAALVGIAGMIWRRHRAADLRGYAVLGGVAAAVLAIRAAVVSALGGPTAVVAGGVGGASVGGTISRVLDDPSTFLSYTWQMFLPRLWFMNDLHVQSWPALDVFIEGGWAAFGWLVVRFPQWVYLVIAGVSILAAALCVVAVVRRRSAALRLGWELAVLLVAIAGVVGGVEAAYFTNSPRPVPAEQGRYIFTAAVPLAAIAMGAAMAFRDRVAPLVASGLAVGVIGLSCASQLLTLTGFFA